MFQRKCALGRKSRMSLRGRVRIHLVVAALFAATLVSAQTTGTPAKTEATAAQPDGQHDFDLLVGTWKANLKLRVHPLSGSNTWVEYEGTQITQKIWGGRAILDEFSAHSPSTNKDVEGLTVRLYNPESRQWSIYWATAKKGAFSLPPTVGHFTNGRGEFYHQEDYEGRPILVRYVWSDITATTAHFEQSFSSDGGKTWETNSISSLTRNKE
jgi:hypothetical protein